MSFENAELETKAPNVPKVELSSEVDIVKDDSGSYAVFTEQGSSAITTDSSKSHGYRFQVAWL